jgi:hypothetical protein
VPAGGTLLEVGVRVRRPGQACGDRPVDIPELPIGQAALETGLCQVTVALANFRLDEIGQLEGRLVAELTDPSRKCLLGVPGKRRPRLAVIAGTRWVLRTAACVASAAAG